MAALNTSTVNLLIKGKLHNDMQNSNLTGSADIMVAIMKIYPFSPSFPCSLALNPNSSGNETNVCVSACAWNSAGIPRQMSSP